MSKYRDRYPWLRLENLYTGKIDEELDAMDDMPEGWKLAFGDMFCEEMDAAIRKANFVDDFVVLQVKEKWGFLHFYVSHNTDEINNIIRKYEVLSSHICLGCGKPDVCMTYTGWQSPFCEDCYNKHISDTRSYAEVTDGDYKMPDVMKYRQYSKEFDSPGWKDFEIDISETAEKIRKRWEERTNKR